MGTTRIKLGLVLICSASIVMLSAPLASAANNNGGYSVRPAEIDDKDPVVRRKAASGAKVQIGKSGKFCGQSAVQMHGGMGVTDELSVSHYFKRLTMIDLMFGNQQHHLTRYSNLAMAA